MQCYVCDELLHKDNETEEHILLNSIGGKLKSKQLICISCNTKMGSSIDDELSSQLNVIGNLLNIKRDRGKPQNVKGTYQNKEILLEPGGKPKLARNYVENNEGVYHIEAPTIRDATKALKGIKRHLKDLDIEKELKKATVNSDALKGIKINLSFGGENVKRAVCKIAVNYFMYEIGDADVIKDLVPYIVGENVDPNAVSYYFPRREVFYKTKEEVCHTLLLIGDQSQKKLFCFVELFNEFKFIVILHNNYQGGDLNKSYHYNVVTNEVINYDAPVSITYKDIKRYSNTEIDTQKFAVRLKLLFQRIEYVTFTKLLDEIIKGSLDRMQQKFPPESYPIVTNEMSDFLSNDIADAFVRNFHSKVES